jgi:hypothetical protein
MHKTTIFAPCGISRGRTGNRQQRMLSLALVVALGALSMANCDMGQFTVNTTAKVLRRAQPSIKMESDYELAARAIPGALKTVEGFWVVDPTNQILISILMEGYCQYGTAFVDDEWERATFAKDLDGVAYQNDRATKIFTRCLNYALMTLGDRWKKEIFAEPEIVQKLIADTSTDNRTPMMFAALALGSIINHNLDSIEIVAHLPTVRQIMERVVEMDDKNPPSDKYMYALPHVALGMIYSAGSAQFGGDPVKAGMQFQKAFDVTDGKFLLPLTLWGYRVGRSTRNQQLFHEKLVKVLETAPSIWPEQRLANEVAHRRARRYLAMEKELFR